jgi:hypothetical protein
MIMAKATKAAQVCKWLTEKDALTEFASSTAKTQSAAHIKPIHWYVCCRLVLEGGFLPEEVFPHPPFAANKTNDRIVLEYSPASASGSEKTVLGGLKTKAVDVVVTKSGIGPVLAISCRGMTGAFRNLTNRMEETIGECTNLHITYPALVFGYMFAIRTNHALDRARLGLGNNDIAVQNRDGIDTLSESILRFHFAMSGMSGRNSIRDDYSKYESVSLVLVDIRVGHEGMVLDSLMPNQKYLKFPRPRLTAGDKSAERSGRNAA